MEIQRAVGKAGTSSDRQKAITESLRQIARMPGFAERNRGIRSYQSHIKSDPWLPILFAICFALPTLVGTLYYGLIASDRYVTEARFAVRPAIGTADGATPDQVGTNAGVPKTMIAQDTLITYSYILSRPMLEAVEAKLPIREWFGRESIDYFSRFNPEKSVEKFLRYWDRRVSISVESGSGILSLSVEAFEPDESLAITQAVIKEAERMVNDLSDRARQAAVADSANELKLAADRVAKIDGGMTDLRNREGLLDAKKSSEANLKLVSELRANRIKFAVQLAVGQRDLGPESRQIVDIKQQIRDLDANIARIEQQSASQNPEQKRRLSDALTRFEALEHDRKEADTYLEMTRRAYDRARIIAGRQGTFFSPVVEPVKAESAVAPRRILMISLIAAASAVLFAGSVFVRKMVEA